MIQDDKLTVDQLADKIKAKYPQYKDMDNQELVDLIIAKYPDYQNVLKKKDSSQESEIVPEDGLDVEPSTSELETGDGESPETSEDYEPTIEIDHKYLNEQGEIAYSINGQPYTREELIENLNDKDFVAKLKGEDSDVQINADDADEMQGLIKKAIDQAPDIIPESKPEEEERIEEFDGENIAKTEIAKINTTQSVPQNTLVNFTESHEGFEANNTLTYDSVDPALHQAIAELKQEWPDHPVFNVESAFRDEDLNNSIEGQKDSYHLHGLALDFTGPTAIAIMDWVKTPAGKKWAEKWTEGAKGGLGVILEHEGEDGEHVHIQFKRSLSQLSKEERINEASAVEVPQVDGGAVVLSEDEKKQNVIARLRNLITDKNVNVEQIINDYLSSGGELDFINDEGAEIPKSVINDQKLLEIYNSRRDFPHLGKELNNQLNDYDNGITFNNVFEHRSGVGREDNSFVPLNELPNWHPAYISKEDFFAMSDDEREEWIKQANKTSDSRIGGGGYNQMPNLKNFKDNALNDFPFRPEDVRNLYTEDEWEIIQKLYKHKGAYHTAQHVSQINYQGERRIKAMELLKRAENKVNEYLDNGWAHVGNGDYLHLASGAVITTKETGGRNPLLADNGLLPFIIESNYNNPYVDENNKGWIGELETGGNDWVREFYEKFKPTDFKYNESEEDYHGGNTDEQEYRRGEHESKMINFIGNISGKTLQQYENILLDNGEMDKFQDIGTRKTQAELWLKEQQALMDKFPKSKDGRFDASELNTADTEILQNLIENYNNFINGPYAKILEEQKGLLESPFAKAYLGVREFHKQSVKYNYGIGDRNEYWGKIQKQKIADQVETDKMYADKTGLGKTWMLAKTWLGDFFVDTGDDFATIPQALSSMFTVNDSYSFADKSADVISDAVNKSSLFNLPTEFQLGFDYQVAEVGDNKVIIKDDKVVQVVDSEYKGVYDSNQRNAIVQEYEENKDDINISDEKHWGSYFYSGTRSLLDLGVDFFVSSRFAGLNAVKKSSLLKKTAKIGFGPQGVGMYSMYNIRQFNENREFAIQNGMTVGEAERYSLLRNSIVGLTQFLAPNTNLFGGASTKLSAEAYTNFLMRGFTKKELYWAMARYNTGLWMKEGGKEAFQEVMELEGDRAFNNFMYDDWSLNKRSRNEMKWDYFQAATTALWVTGVPTLATSGRFRSSETNLSLFYNESLLWAFDNLDVAMSNIDNMVAKNQDILIGDKTIKLTPEIAKEIKDGLKNDFSNLDNYIDQAKQNGHELDKTDKTYLLQLIQAKKNVQSKQNSKNPVEAQAAKETLERAESNIARILNGENSREVMVDPEVTAIDNLVKAAVGEDVDISLVSPAARFILNKQNKGGRWSSRQKKSAEEGLNNEIDKLDKKKKLSRDESAILSLYQELLNDITKTKPTVNEETDTTLDETIEQTKKRFAPVDKGKGKQSPRKGKGASIRENVEKTEQDPGRTTISQNLGKRVIYKGKQGILSKDKDGNIIIKTPGRGRNIKIKEAKRDNMMLNTAGIEFRGAPVNVSPDGIIKVGDKAPTPFVAISRDDSGGVSSIVTENPDFTKRVINRSKRQLVKLQEQRNAGEISLKQFEQAIKTLNGLNLISDSDIKYDIASQQMINDISSNTDLSVITPADISSMTEEALNEEGQSETQQELDDDVQMQKDDKKKKTIKVKSKLVETSGRKYDKNNLSDLLNRAKTHLSGIGAINQVRGKVLEIAHDIFGNLGYPIVVHNNSISIYNDMIKKGYSEAIAIQAAQSKGFFLKGGEIHVNLETASENTMFHEGAHPFINSLLELMRREGVSGGPITNLINSLESDLKKTKRPGTESSYWDYGMNYAHNPMYSDNGPLAEALAEYLADAGLKKFNDNNSLTNRTINSVKSILTSLGIGPKNWTNDQNPLDMTLEDINNMTNISDIKNVFAGAISKGQPINIDMEYREDVRNDNVDPQRQYNVESQVNTHSEYGGSTFNNLFGDVGGQPYTSVSIFTDRTKKIKGKDVTQKDIDNFIKNNKSIFDQHESLSVGTWFNPKDGFTYIDISSVIPKSKQKEAEALGKKHNQISIFDLETFEEIETGGDGTNVNHTPENLQERIKTIIDIVGDLKGPMPESPQFQMAEPAGTKGFSEWFGNSMLVKNGKPIVFYHGTNSLRTSRILGLKFQPDRLTPTKQEWEGEGVIFLSPDAGFANTFAAMDDSYLPNFENLPPGARIIPLYVKAENVWDYENPKHRQLIEDSFISDGVVQISRREFTQLTFGLDRGEFRVIEKYTTLIRNLGFDGFYVSEQVQADKKDPKYDEYETVGDKKRIVSKNLAVFESNQVRSINRTDFTDVTAPQFQVDETKHSNILNAIIDSNIDRGDANQWMDEFKRVGNENLTKDLNFIGMKNFLEASEGAYEEGMIPNQVVLDFVITNQAKVELKGSTIKISNPLYDLATLDVENKITDDGERTLFVNDILAPDKQMLPNLEPTLRRLIRFASDSRYDSISFQVGDNFKGPRVDFFNSNVPDVIADILDSVDSSAGPVLTEIDGTPHISIDITPKIAGISTEVNLPSFQIREDNITKTHLNRPGKVIEWIKGWFFSQGNIPTDLFQRHVLQEGERSVWNFRLKNTKNELEGAINSNQRGKAPISLLTINEALKDPTNKINSLQSELNSMQNKLDKLSDEGKSFVLPKFITEINNLKKRIKKLKDEHRGRGTLKDLESDPKLLEAVKNSRALIDEISSGLSEYATDGLKATIDENMGTYLYKQYRTHHDTEYQKGILSILEQMDKTGKSAQELSEKTTEFQREYELIQKAADLIRTQLQKEDPNITEGEVIGKIRKLFTRPGSEFSKDIVKTRNVPKHTLKRRQDITDVISELLNPIDNPVANLVNTVATNSGILEMAKYQRDVVNMMTGKMLFKNPSGRYDQEIELDGQVFYTSLDLKEHIEFWKNNNTSAALQFLNSINAYTKIGKTILSLKTHARNMLGNPGFMTMSGHVFGGNLIEGFRTSFQIFKTSSNKQRQQIFEEMLRRGVISSARADEMQSFFEEGIGVLDVHSDLFENDIYKTNGKIDPKKWPRKALDVMTKLYQLEDIGWKAAGFMTEMDIYMKAGYSRKESMDIAGKHIRDTYPTYELISRAMQSIKLNPLVGDFVSFPAEVLRTSKNSLVIAGQQLLSGNPVLVRAGLTRMLGTAFVAGAWGNLYKTLTFAGVSAMVWLAGKVGLIDDGEEDEYLLDWNLMMGNEVHVGDDDIGFTFKEGITYQDNYISRDKMMQLFYPSWMKFGDVSLVSISETDGMFDGNMTIWNVTDNNAHGYIQEIWNSIWDSPESDPTWAMNDFQAKWLWAFLEPYLGAGILTKSITNISQNKNEQGGKIFKTTDDFTTRSAKSLVYLLEKAGPSAIKDYERIMKSYNPDFVMPWQDPVDEEDKWRQKEYNQFHEIFAQFGTRLSRFNIMENFMFSTRDISRKLKGIDTRGEDPVKMRTEVKELVDYLDKAYIYSEALGIESDGILIKREETDLFIEPSGQKPLNDLRRTIILENSGIKMGTWLYAFLVRNREEYPDFDSYFKGGGWRTMLTSWQEEELDKEEKRQLELQESQ